MKILLLIFLCSNLIIAQSQNNSTISGIIKDRANNQPLAGVNILVMNTNYGAATNLKGNFSIKVPEGIYSLRISMIGYKDLIIDNLFAAANKVVSIDTSLTEKIITLQSVIVTPKPEKYDATGLTAKLDRNMVKHSPGSAQDIFWTLQTLPGVSSGSDDSKLYVRGGNASENLILFDGATIANPYHFEFMGGGLFSIFNSRLIEDVKFYAGGFPARYGDRLSSVLVINNKTANVNQFNGEVNLSLTDFNGIVEFPLKELNGSGFISARRSYFDVVYDLIPDLKAESDAVPYFYDFYGKLDFNLPNLGKLTLTGLNSFENLYGVFNYDHFNGTMNSDGYNQSFGARLNLILSDNSVNELNIYYSRADKEAVYPLNSYENYNIKEYGLKNDLSFLFSNHEIHLGGWLVFKDDEALVNLPGEINFYTLEDYQIKSSGKAVLYSVYSEDKVKLTEQLSFNAGLRFDYLDKIKKGVLSPRFNFAYSWNEHMSLSFDYGWYYQSPTAYETAANLRAGSLLRSGSEASRQGPSLNFKKAESIGFGIKHQISDELIVNLELYNKRFYDLVAYNNDSQTLSSDGFGFARGAEIYFQIKPDENAVGWLSYSYSIAKRKEGVIRSEEFFSFDRTHLLSAVFNYKFSEVWSIGVKYRFGTGTPYTPVTGSYFDGSADKFFPVLGSQNSSRYPSYSRLDVRLTRLFFLSNFPLEIYLEVLNTLNNKNVIHWIYNLDYTSKSQMAVFSLLPVIGVNLKI